MKSELSRVELALYLSLFPLLIILSSFTPLLALQLILFLPSLPFNYFSILFLLFLYIKEEGEESAVATESYGEESKRVQRSGTFALLVENLVRTLS